MWDLPPGQASKDISRVSVSREWQDRMLKWLEKSIQARDLRFSASLGPRSGAFVWRS